MSKRRIYKLVIFGNLSTGNEERQFEAANLSEAVMIKDGLLNGRPYYSLSEVMTVERSAVRKPNPFPFDGSEVPENDECSHNWEHDEASNEFVCTRCLERKGG